MTVQTSLDGVISSDLYDARTTDGILLTDLVQEADSFVAAYNALKNTMLSFMGYETTSIEADVVSQKQVLWGRFAEFGKPDVRSRSEIDYAVTTGIEGYQTAIEWTDFAEVLQLTAAALQSHVTGVVEGDLSRSTLQMWQQFFEKEQRPVVDLLLKKRVIQLPFYNGDSRIPPRAGNTAFTSPHNHYLRTATNNVIVSADLDALVNTVIHHGFDADVYLFGDQTTVDAIMAIGSDDIAKIQVVNRFIPLDAVNINQPGALVSTWVPVNPMFNVYGSFKGKANIAVAKDAPAGYIGCFSHEGPMSPNNPLQVRMPPQAALAVLRRIFSTLYPFVGTYWSRLMGISTRQFGNGAAMQYANQTGGSYASPTWTYTTF